MNKTAIKISAEARQAMRRARARGWAGHVKAPKPRSHRPYGRAKRSGNVTVNRALLRLFMMVWLTEDSVPETPEDEAQYYHAVGHLARACGLSRVPL